MADRLGVGFVGAGFNTNFHARSWVGVRNADIRGIADPDTSRAEATAQACRNLGVGDPKAYADVSELVADPNIDALWICAPNYTRIAIMETIAEVLKSGKGTLKGIACEKPLARNVAEAKKMVEIVNELGLLHGYLENQVFSPSIVRGREIIWHRGAKVTGRPYLARAAEEHSGPHESWFWSGQQQGGGVLNDMMCHSIEAARFLLSDPDKPKSAMRPVTVNAEIATLKWSRKEYIDLLKEMSDNRIDYGKTPAEDFARANVNFEDQDGNILVAEVTTSWSFVGPGLRLSFEMMGPEYYMQINSLEPELHIFFSRKVVGKAGEDLVEKQAAEQGLMPVISDEGLVYGYTGEDRYMVNCFLEGKMPEESFNDGLLVSQLLMTAYKSSEEGKKLAFDPAAIQDFVPKVARGTYRATDAIHTAF
ncbi:MAG: Gfo/Idh/MocA family oxidoreductase [Actinobacteria bacterium]|nr:Gfo/Idh/MocA family oxidoreductase [Actinomycetota bacterium]